jgi:ferric-dicitrate binding protein FerR (iron transport regulator)
MNFEQLRSLFSRYLDGSITSDEENELMRLLSADLSKDEIDQLLEEFYDNLPDKFYIEERDSDRIFRSILNQSGKKRRPHYIMFRKVAAIAASILILISIGYIYTDQRKRDNITSEIIKNDILPGGEKAILTLADGSVVVLDKTRPGVVSDEGAATVVKQGDNRLVYNSGKTSADKRQEFNTLATPRCGEFQLVLSDGTKVWLNSESTITYPVVFDGKERHVVVSGEVYFEVSKTAKKTPFIVELKDRVKIEVLGTQFNVNAYDDDNNIKTTLIEGSVKIVSTSTNRSIVIKPGEQAGIDRSGNLSVKEVDTEEAIAWKNGRFIFDNADINTIMRQISRWYDIDIEYGGVVNQHFGGSISRKVNASKVFEMLEMTGEINFEISGRKVIVKPVKK